jgi:hypothetical protein
VLLQHMTETLRRHGGPGGGGSPGGAAGALAGALLPAVAGGLGSGVAGAVGGLLASFLTGSAATGRRQTPVMCCNTPIDLARTPLMI